MHTADSQQFQLQDQLLAARIERCKTLPSPPAVAVQVLEIARNPAAGMADIARIVQVDPAMCTKILRIANSPLYGMQRTIDNLKQAITVLGLHETTALALSFSLINALHDTADPGLDYAHFWRRSLATATAARAIAKALRLPNQDRYFLAGLLQDIGMLALDKAFPAAYRRPDADPTDHHDITLIEHAELGVDHADIGAWLLQRWNFPEHFLYAVFCSHSPTACEVPEEYRQLVNSVYVAALIADVWWQQDWEVQISLATAEAHRLLGMQPAQFAEMLAAETAMLKDAATLFDVELGDAAVLDELLEEAMELVTSRALDSMRQVVELRERSRTLSAQTRQLEEQTRRDKLTGLFNRAHFDQVLASEYDRALSTGAPLTIAFVDMDGLKEVNDVCGHQTGDDVIRQFASLLSRIAGDGVTVARYGGDEFVIVLPDTQTGTAQRLGVQLVGAISQGGLSGTPANLKVGASIGIATCSGNTRFSSARALLAAADAAVYMAKGKGGRTVVTYGTDPAADQARSTVH